MLLSVVGELIPDRAAAYAKVAEPTFCWEGASTRVACALSGNADVEPVGLTVAGHDSARADHAPSTYGDAGEDDCTGPDP